MQIGRQVRGHGYGLGYRRRRLDYRGANLAQATNGGRGPFVSPALADIQAAIRRVADVEVHLLGMNLAQVHVVGPRQGIAALSPFGHR